MESSNVQTPERSVSLQPRDRKEVRGCDCQPPSRKMQMTTSKRPAFFGPDLIRATAILCVVFPYLAMLQTFAAIRETGHPWIHRGNLLVSQWISNRRHPFEAAIRWDARAVQALLFLETKMVSNAAELLFVPPSDLALFRIANGSLPPTQGNSFGLVKL